ncbi:MAG: type II toxin-antitoxin system RelE/ParE family toxin [Caldilineaceae bacterium]|nr:type II toxin-antitoxin system RelE/ParE family toxin [Caldilineaceae bacterium]
MRWTPRYDVEAVRAIYTLPRGVAGEVTEAIKTLLSDPRPPKSEPVPGRDQTFQIHVQGHRVEYELMEEQQIIKILFIE